MARILFCEDEEDLLSSLVAYFTREGFEVFHARGGKAGLEIASRHKVDIAVLDVMMHEGPEGPGGLDGFQILSELRRTGFATREHRGERNGCGTHHTVTNEFTTIRHRTDCCFGRKRPRPFRRRRLTSCIGHC